MKSDFDRAVERITAAKSAVELFGVKDQLQEYRRLAKVVHPDRVPVSFTLKATTAFMRLSELWSSIKVMTVKSYKIESYLGGDSLVDWFLGTDSAKATSFLFKVNTNPVNNDLMRREAENLKHIYNGLDSRHEAFFPMLIESFSYRDEATDADRIINVFADDEKWYSLKAIMDAFPDGLDGRHIAWIWRRVLVTLGAAHMGGVVHGAVLPDNILINPELHAVRLVNWCFSASGTQRVPGLVTTYRNWYHDDVKAKKLPTPITDIYTATQTMMNLFDAPTRIPGQLYEFIQLCIGRRPCHVNASPHRPLAFIFLAELDKELEAVYGPRTFTIFPEVPKTIPVWPSV